MPCSRSSTVTATPRRASQFKTLVFNTTERAQVDEAMGMMRAAAADPEMARQVLSVSQPYRTPSLLGGAALAHSDK